MKPLQKASGSPFHLQDGKDFCGAAVALMMLSDGDIGGDPGGLSEDDLFNEGSTVSKNSGFIVSDEGLVSILNKFNPGKAALFDSRRELSEKVGTARIVAHLCDASPVSPAALIYGSQHWVAIESIWTDVEPAAQPGVNYTLRMLSMHDPNPVSGIKIKHKINDDCPLNGVPSRLVFYPDGWRDRFDGAAIGPKTFFLVVGRSESKDIAEPGEVSLPTLSEMNVRVGVDGLIEQPDLVNLWRETLKAYGGLPVDSPDFSALTGAQPNVNSVITEDWNHNGKVCYLVALQVGGNTVGTWVLNAQTGAFDSIEVHLPGHFLAPAYKRIETDLAGARLVWEPCLESFSPHLPFMLREKGGLGLFERLDGKVFSGLTTDRKGI